MENSKAIQVWNKCLAIIRDNISSQSFKTWFEPIKPLKLENNILTVQVPSPFFYEFIEEHFIDLLRKTIKTQLGNEGRLEYSIVMSNSTKKPTAIKLPANTNSTNLKNSSIALPLDINAGSIKNPFIIPGIKKITIDSQLNPNYSFDNFIEGDCNRLARSAGLAVASKPGGTSFNPLFLYSESGLGKTHLANAIGIQIKNNFPNKTVLYVRSSEFQTQFTESIRNNNQNDFVNFYQMIDVLIIDDIQFLAGKKGTLDIFFHIFNHLHQLGKQLILTSDRAPSDLEGIEQRLLSRFKWGLTADLQSPDYETRLAIVQKKMYNEGFELEQEVVEYVARNASSNIRELEGILISLLAHSAFNKKSITIDTARKIVDNFIKQKKQDLSIDIIKQIVCDYFKISMEQINSKSRKREIVQARQLAMYFSKKYTDTSLAIIGLNCGGKDHATVLHSCKTVDNLLDTDKRFKMYYEDINKKIKSI